MFENLKEYFRQRNDIAFAFLFGSYARKKSGKLSDVDIAVYFYPMRSYRNRHPIEYEADVFYKGEIEIWSDLQKILKKEVELLILNRVPANVAASAIRGVPIIINDWGLYIDFMEVIVDEAEEYQDFVLNYYKERSALAKRI